MTSAVLGSRPTRSRRFAAVASVMLSAVVTWAKTHRSASLSNLRKMPFTVAGLGCIDTGVFNASPVAGWIVTGLSLIVLEYAIADEQ